MARTTPIASSNDSVKRCSGSVKSGEGRSGTLTDMVAPSPRLEVSEDPDRDKRASRSRIAIRADSIPVELERRQNALGIREIAADPPLGRRALPDERRQYVDPVHLGELGMLDHVDDDEACLSFQVLVADPPEIGDRPEGLRGMPRHVELKADVTRPRVR